jgi:hypothetical protein
MAGGHSGNAQSGTQNRGEASGQQTGGGSIYEQAGSAVSGLTETASDLWDDVYDHGEQYYQQGRRAIGRLDGVTLGGLVAAGALGFAVAWLMYNNRTDRGAERTHESRGKRARRRDEGRQGHGKQRGQSHG